MKKLLAITLTLLMLAGCVSLSAFAETADSADVYVTIADADGNLALAYVPVTVTDSDDDGLLTVNDALYAAHEAHFDGGAAAGYASAKSEYGLSLNKLWGVANGGSYGYTVNHASAMSLADPVQAGDLVAAYVYTDLATWSDTYCYFDVNTTTADAGEAITLTLKANSYDADWNPVTVPVEGATITLNGQATEICTDAAGKAVITVEKGGNYVISAVSEAMVLVPPVCLAEIAGGPVDAPVSDTQPSTDSNPSTGSNSTTTKTETTAPKTGDSGIAVAGMLLVTAGAVILTSKKRNG